MRISIILPSWNRIDYIEETIASVQEQSVPNWELIIVDDISTDGSFDVLQKIASQNERITAIQRKGSVKGANACRNEGAQMATGEYCIFLDSDDLLHRDCIKNRILEVQKDPAHDFYTFPTLSFREKPGDSAVLWNKTYVHESKNDDIDRFLNVDPLWQTTSVLWRKDFYTKLGGFDEQLPCWQDWDIHVRAICASISYKKCELPPDNYYRLNSDMSIRKTNAKPKSLAGRLYLINKTYETLASEKLLNTKRKRLTARLYYQIAIEQIANGVAVNSSAISQWKSNNLLTSFEQMLWIIFLKREFYKAENNQSILKKIIDIIFIKIFGYHFAVTNATYLKTTYEDK